MSAPSGTVTKILKNHHLLTKLDIWAPRYSSQYTKDGEWVVLLAKYKVDQASPTVIVEFTKAKHLKGQRYCIDRSEAQTYQLATNSKIPCYAVPMSAFSSWITNEEDNEHIRYTLEEMRVEGWLK